MTPKQIELVQATWARLVPIKDQAAALFYRTLFDMDPALQSLFKGDMIEQGRKLMAMIGTAVNGLARLDALLPAVRDLGRRHASYGVKEAHYATVGAALLLTLEQGLGDAFTPEVRGAWTTAYMVLATTMQQRTATHIFQDAPPLAAV